MADGVDTGDWLTGVTSAREAGRMAKPPANAWSCIHTRTLCPFHHAYHVHARLSSSERKEIIGFSSEPFFFFPMISYMIDDSPNKNWVLTVCLCKKLFWSG